MHALTVETRSRCQMIDVTSQVQQAVAEENLQNGYVIAFVPHTTAGLTIQENADPDVVHDFLWKFEQLVPQNESAFRHSEGNSDAHIKTSMVGSSEMLLVEQGRLVLGTWQSLYFCEFDGPRRRRLLVKCVADTA